ncbi:MAG: hypothetical protein AAF674_12955 [Pseudomonadota bacterium]
MLWRVTPHAVDTRAGFARLIRPPGISDDLWFHLAEGLAAILNTNEPSTDR